MEHAIAEAREARLHRKNPPKVKDIREIKLSNEADCAQSKYCFSPASKFEVRAKWIKQRELYIDSNARAFTEVLVDGESYMMDCLTGSLYKDRVCITNPSLTVDGLERSQEVAAQYLMSRNPFFDGISLSEIDGVDDGTR